MKYCLITDNNVGWFTYLVSIHETGEACETFDLPFGLTNEFLSNIFSRCPSFTNLKIMLKNSSLDTFCGTFISKYDFDRIKKMIEIYPAFLEYNRLGRLEKI